jgi:hypothetical protein
MRHEREGVPGTFNKSKFRSIYAVIVSAIVLGVGYSLTSGK